jgi:hypothetical protein
VCCYQKTKIGTRKICIKIFILLPTSISQNIYFDTHKYKSEKLTQTRWHFSSHVCAQRRGTCMQASKKCHFLPAGSTEPRGRSLEPRGSSTKLARSSTEPPDSSRKPHGGCGCGCGCSWCLRLWLRLLVQLLELLPVPVVALQAHN